jgi:osmoprotectant transport system substrate-binding protein
VVSVRPAIVGAALVALTACAESGEPSDAAASLDDDTITIGSFDFPESVLLAELYSQALESAGFSVDRAFALGPREFVGPALHSGLIEFVPEYAGTAVTFFSAGGASASADAEATHRTLAEAIAGSGVTALDAAPAQNANVFVVTPDTARRYRLTTLSDLRPVAGELVLGGPPECPSRQLCQLGLAEVYGLTFADFVALDAGGSVTHQALDNGDVDIAVLFGTDPQLADYVVLADDRQLQPAENVTPLVRDELVERFGTEFVEVVDAVSHRLDTDSVRRLNSDDLETAGAEDTASIAAAWLDERGLR